MPLDAVYFELDPFPIQILLRPEWKCFNQGWFPFEIWISTWYPDQREEDIFSEPGISLNRSTICPPQLSRTNDNHFVVFAFHRNKGLQLIVFIALAFILSWKYWTMSSLCI
jgi:hypothetical protein